MTEGNISVVKYMNFNKKTCHCIYTGCLGKNISQLILFHCTL